MTYKKEKNGKSPEEKKRRAIAVWCVFLFAAGTAIPFTPDKSRLEVLTVFAVSMIFYGISAVLILHFRPAVRLVGKRKLPGPAGRLIRYTCALSDRKYLLFIWVLTLLIWMPAFLALYPGTFGYDAPFQLAMYTGDSPWTAQHPVLHTLLLGFLVETVGRGHLGSSIRGLALYSLIQAAIISYALARSFLLLRRRSVSLWIRIGGYIWVALNPFIEVLVFAATKDILFGAFLLLFVTDLEEMRMAEGKNKRRLYTALSIISGTLMCLFRNQGIYILIVAFFIMLLVFRRRIMEKGRRRIAAILFLSACLSGILSSVLASTVRAEKGDMKEMLSVPMQQIAYVANEQMDGEKDVLRDEELRTIEEVIPEEGLRSYMPAISDPVKEAFKTDVFLKNPGRYISLYFRIGLRCPGPYARAFWSMIAPFWDMSQNSFRYLLMRETPDPVMIWRDLGAHSRFPILRDFFYAAVVNDDTAQIPVLGLLFEPGLTLTLLLAGFGICLIRRREHAAVTQLFFILYVLTMLLGPVALVRYLWPVMLATPLMLGTLSPHFSGNAA